jgi:ParB-like chromosome segregation protein Spo0J
MKFHDAANIFPLLEDDELDALANDIKRHGLREPIETLDGEIIDGRNRYRACLLRQVKPVYEAIETDDPVAYVLSKNLHRRHLTPSQISMVGARAREHYDREAEQRMRAGKKCDPMENLPQGTARDQAAKAVGVSGRTIDYATKVLEQGTPELIKAVDEGRMAVSSAAVFASEPPEKQKEVLASGRHNRRYKAGIGGGGEPTTKNRKDTATLPEGEHCGVGVIRANEAINCLIRIPKNDPLRKRGFQIVTDWIKANK